MTTGQQGGAPLTCFGRAAIAYAARLRLHVLPLLPCKKEPCGRLVPHGFVDATIEAAVIERWWHLVPGANVGIACAPSGVIVIDVDPRNGGDDSLVEVERELGPLPRTWTVLTPGGGAHYYLRCDGADPIAGVLGPGVDVKHRGYVAAPPSVHPNGGVYRWDSGVHPLEATIAQVPSIWLARMRTGRGPPRASSGLDACESFLGVAFDALAWLGEPLPHGKRQVRCPWLPEHSDGRGDGRDSSTVIFPCAAGSTIGGFVCSHAHCAGRDVLSVVRCLPPEAIEAAARRFPGAYRRLLWRLASPRAGTP